MRSPKSRSRAKGNRRPQGNIVNRVFDSSGPEGKVRGTPQQIIDKYLSLARDAQLGNDRVAAENYQQHAEHYIRLLAEAQREQEARRERQEAQQQQQGGGGRAQDDDDGAGTGAPETGEADGPSPRKPRRRSSGRGGENRADVAPGGGEVVDLDGTGDSGLVETPEGGAPMARTGTTGD